MLHCNSMTLADFFLKEGEMAPVIRIDDEVMGELKKRAIALDKVFEAPNTILRIVLGLDSQIQPQTATHATPTGKQQRFGRVHVATPVRDTTTAQIYRSKYKAGLAFVREFPNIDKRYVWYPLIRKYPGRFIEVATGKAPRGVT
jgi:hypothetical protein